jgi:excisionase family DNA binding protein
MEELLQELKEIKQLLTLKKDVLTLDEFCVYAGISKHQAYHLTSKGKIKFYRPFGKMIYLSLEDIKEYLLQNPTASSTELRRQTNRKFYN